MFRFVAIVCSLLIISLYPSQADFIWKLNLDSVCALWAVKSLTPRNLSVIRASHVVLELQLSLSCLLRTSPSWSLTWHFTGNFRTEQTNNCFQNRKLSSSPSRKRQVKQKNTISLLLLNMVTDLTTGFQAEMSVTFVVLSLWSLSVLSKKRCWTSFLFPFSLFLLLPGLYQLLSRSGKWLCLILLAISVSTHPLDPASRITVLECGFDCTLTRLVRWMIPWISYTKAHNSFSVIFNALWSVPLNSFSSLVPHPWTSCSNEIRFRTTPMLCYFPVFFAHTVSPALLNPTPLLRLNTS